MKNLNSRGANTPAPEERALEEVKRSGAGESSAPKSFRARRRRLLAALFILILTPVLLTGGINLYLLVATRAQIQTVDELKGWNADCILVLGAGVWGENQPSPLLEDRLLTGIEAFEAQIAPRILMSGDHGQSDYNEVETMRNYALNDGLPSEAVFMDHAGFSTYESLYRAKNIFGVKKLLIVTQRYHLSRALYLASALGLEAKGLASDRRQLSGQSKRELRELAARVKDFGFAILKPRPSYEGRPIDLNGAVTQCFDRKSLDRLYQAHPTLQPNYPAEGLLAISYAPPVADLLALLGPPARQQELNGQSNLSWPLPDDYQIVCQTSHHSVLFGVHIIKAGRTAQDFSPLRVGESTLDDLYKIDPYINPVAALDGSGQLCEIILPDRKALQFIFKPQGEILILREIREIDSLLGEDIYALIG